MHEVLHLLQVLFLFNLLKDDLLAWLFAILGAFIIDLDHLPLIRRLGLKKFIYLRTKIEAKKARKYALHNFFMLGITLIGSIFILSQWTFYFGIFFLSAFLHLVIDLVYSSVLIGSLNQWFH